MQSLTIPLVDGLERVNKITIILHDLPAIECTCDVLVGWLCLKILTAPLIDIFLQGILEEPKCL